jgi:hypothetical protein
MHKNDVGVYIPLAVTGATHGLRQLGTFGDTFVARVFSDDFAFLTSGYMARCRANMSGAFACRAARSGSALGLCYRAASSPRVAAINPYDRRRRRKLLIPDAVNYLRW